MVDVNNLELYIDVIVRKKKAIEIFDKKVYSLRKK